MAKQSRIHLVTRAAATEEQKQVGDFIYLKRDEEYAGPSAIMLNVPDLANVFEHMREHLEQAGLPDDLYQLATLVLARHWSVSYIWNVRVRQSRAIGIDEVVIDAIKNRRRPIFSDPRQDAIYTYTSEMLGPAGVSDAAYRKAKEVLGGENQVIELTALIGLYTFLSFQCRAADLPAQANGQELQG
jgi:4-carboxymuconolactone decarboxylase